MKTEQKVRFESLSELLQHLEPLRSQGKTVVTTNGCFDILHIGHIQYLTEAAALGDILVVGINCDVVVRKLKGEHRPVQPENHRLQIIASLKMVDAAFIFHEDDPRSFLSAIKPDFHVKGGDYTSDLLERETVESNGGRIAIVSHVQGSSTTRLVQKINTP